MCTLHADIRISEGLLAGLFRKAHNLKLVSELNTFVFEFCGVIQNFVLCKTGGYEQHGLSGKESKRLRKPQKEDPDTVMPEISARYFF